MFRFTSRPTHTLVLRDMKILKRSAHAKVGFTITTADEKIRRIFEPEAPPVRRSIEALATLHSGGIRTFAMTAPVPPGAEGLVSALKGKVHHVLIDRLNYHYADRIYKKQGMQWAREEDFFTQMGRSL